MLTWSVGEEYILFDDRININSNGHMTTYIIGMIGGAVAGIGAAQLSSINIKRKKYITIEKVRGRAATINAIAGFVLAAFFIGPLVSWWCSVRFSSHDMNSMMAYTLTITAPILIWVGISIVRNSAYWKSMIASILIVIFGIGVLIPLLQNLMM